MKYQHKIILNIIRLATALAFSVLFFTASGSVQYTLNLSASQNANSSGKEASAPIAVSIYSLASSSRFSKAKYFTLEDSSHRTLRTDLIKKQQVLLLPNKSQSITIDSGEDVRYIGIVASYNTLKGKVWRRVVDLGKVKLKTITVHIERTRVRISLPKSPKAIVLPRNNKFYIGGSLSVGSVKLQDQYQLNKFNT
jgi:type VI secretion system VasD/TssJ family lipoprotein